MKKTFLNLVVALFVVTLAACGGSSSSSTDSGGDGGGGDDGMTASTWTDVEALLTTADAMGGTIACSVCHNGAAGAHELDLSSWSGIMLGADIVSEPPGVSVLGGEAPGSCSWGDSKLRARLRNNRMPPDANNASRDTDAGKDIQAWVEGGATEAGWDTVGANTGMSPAALFSSPTAFGGSVACSVCHNGVAGAHELGLGSYADILIGADSVSEPPGVSVLGESSWGAGDFTWSGSKMQHRLRNNRMPPNISSTVGRDDFTAVIESWVNDGCKDN